MRKRRRLRYLSHLALTGESVADLVLTTFLRFELASVSSPRPTSVHWVLRTLQPGVPRPKRLGPPVVLSRGALWPCGPVDEQTAIVNHLAWTVTVWKQTFFKAACRACTSSNYAGIGDRSQRCLQSGNLRCCAGGCFRKQHLDKRHWREGPAT